MRQAARAVRRSADVRWGGPATLLLGLLLPAGCLGQLCSTTHTTDLYCLIPASFHTEAAPFNALFTPFGTELGQLPIAKPVGLVLTFEHGLLVPSRETLGAVFAERAETLGRHRVYLGFSYQNFTFDRIDGLDLKQLPIVLYFAPLNVYTVTNDRIDVRVGQYTAVAAAGLTSRIDVSVAMPFERVRLATTISGTEIGPGGATAAVEQAVPGASRGFGDVVIGGKGLILEREGLRFAAGVDVRVPTGNEFNFLGAGTVGVRPYLAASRKGRTSPHLIVGYQWNGDSILNADTAGGKQRLPTDFFYTAGVNVEAAKRLTLVADLLGKHFFDAPRLAAPASVPGLANAVSIQPYIGSYTANDLSLGLKTQTIAHLLFTANVTLKLDAGGLRARAVPLVGLSYSF